MPVKTILAILLIILVISPITIINPAYAGNKNQYESENIRIRVIPRSPQQIAAFYEARGFQKNMLDKIKQYCFITIYVRNKGKHIIWHDLGKWTFQAGTKKIQRIDRHQLKQTWQKMGIPLPHQSTFRWTLLPEQLDFRPEEGEGGNIVLPATNENIRITSQFNLYKNNSDDIVKLILDNIQCKK
ncbi:MAG: hypothetical protein OEY52_10790 [Gammaproteobacteria bacterium]|nr:hypothetical protein [Gammaproteobacteria bacterium]